MTDQIIGLVASRHALPRWIAPCVSAGLARAIHHGADTKQHGDRHEDNKDNGMLHVAASLLRAPTPPDVCGFSAVQAECAVNRQWNRKGNMILRFLSDASAGAELDKRKAPVELNKRRWVVVSPCSASPTEV